MSNNDIFFYFVRQLNNIILRNYQLPHCMFSNFVLSPECYMVPSTALYMRWTTKFFDLNLKLLYIGILNRRRKKMNEKKLNLLIRFRTEVIKLTLKPIFARSNGYDWKIIFTFMSNYFVCDLFSLTQQHIFFLRCWVFSVCNIILIIHALFMVDKLIIFTAFELMILIRIKANLTPIRLILPSQTHSICTLFYIWNMCVCVKCRKCPGFDR